MLLIVNSKFLIIFCGHIFRHSRTFSKSPQKFIPTSLLPENQYSILNYSAWRKWRLWRNGGEVSATSATFATCHFYISREYIFLKKVFVGRKLELNIMCTYERVHFIRQRFFKEWHNFFIFYREEIHI